MTPKIPKTWIRHPPLHGNRSLVIISAIPQYFWFSSFKDHGRISLLTPLKLSVAIWLALANMMWVEVTYPTYEKKPLQDSAWFAVLVAGCVPDGEALLDLVPW